MHPPFGELIVLLSHLKCICGCLGVCVALQGYLLIDGVSPLSLTMQLECGKHLVLGRVAFCCWEKAVTPLYGGWSACASRTDETELSLDVCYS